MLEYYGYKIAAVRDNFSGTWTAEVTAVDGTIAFVTPPCGSSLKAIKEAKVFVDDLK